MRLEIKNAEKYLIHLGTNKNLITKELFKNKILWKLKLKVTI